MIRERLTAMLVPLAALLLLVTGCDDLALPGSAPEAPAASPAAGASATPTAAPSPRAAPVLTPDGPLYIIVTNTGGEGVAVRDACDPDARVSAPGEGIRDGSFVEFLRGGTGDCGGWMYVRDHDGRESWVRAGYLGPVPAPLPTPEAGDNATPDGTADVIVAATPEVSPTRRTDSFFQLYGFAPPGNVIHRIDRWFAVRLDRRQCHERVDHLCLSPRLR